MKMSKWTTYCGIAQLVGVGINEANFCPLMNKIGLFISGLAIAIGLYIARDNKVSDEQAGAGQTKTTTNNK